jgi:RNA polymerase sigma-70 factor (ECF subfamily)
MSGDAPQRPSSDREAIAAIYDREFDYVWHALRRLGIPARDLPDLTHDVFFTLFRTFDRYDATRPLRPWLFGVIFRVASDHINLSRNRREVLHATADLPDLSTQDPVGVLESLNEWRLVDRVLEGLGLRQRAVLVMHDLLGYKGHEIADTLEIPLKTVFSRLAVARARFEGLALAALQPGPPAKVSPAAGTKR